MAVAGIAFKEIEVAFWELIALSKDFLLSGNPYWLSILVSAALTMGATFLGVFLSFRLEHQKERSTFGRLIESVLIESANNQSVLNKLRNKLDASFAVRTECLEAALASPLTLKYAPWSLVKVMSIALTYITRANNVLDTIGSGRMFGEDEIASIKIEFNKCVNLIKQVLQPEVERLRPQFGTQMRYDDHAREVDENLKAALNGPDRDNREGK